MDLAELLEFIGLNAEAITHIVNIYDPEVDPRADLWDYIKSWVLSSRSDEYVAEDEYQQELIRCGLSEDLAVKHMDAEFAVFRRMQDPWFWALDTLRMRHDQAIGEFTGEPLDGRRESQSLSEKKSSSKFSALASRLHEDKERPSTTEEGLARGILGEGTTFRQPRSDEILWFKGAVKSRLLDGYSTTTLRTSFRLLLSNPPTDFWGIFSCLCLTDSASAAERYAAWATRRANHRVPDSAEPLILVLYISKHWLRDLQERGQFRRLRIDEFQMLVWWNYREAQAGAAPDAIKDIYQSKVIHGPINAKSPMQIRRLANSNEIVPGILQGQTANQICVPVFLSNNDTFRTLAGFEARLVEPVDLPAIDEADDSTGLSN